ncbi:MAG: hypothetical protein ACHQT8_06770 [Chlamydiales bacterium]
MTQRVGSSPHGENFVRYSEGPQHDSAISYSGAARDVVGLILGFAQERRLSRVSRVWQQENLPILRRIIQQIRFEDAAMQAKMERVREELAASGATMFGAVTAAHTALRQGVNSVLNTHGVNSMLLNGHFPRICQIDMVPGWYHWRRQTPGEEEMWDLQTLIFCREWNVGLQQLLAQLPEDLDGSPEYEALLEQAHRFTVQGDLALRLHKTTHDRRLNPQARIEDVAAALSALHARQREHARALGQNDERAFHSAPLSDSHSYFLEVESEFRRRRLADPAQTLALQRLWHGSAQDFEQNPPMDADEIRRRLMNPLQANPDFTSTFHENLSVIPPEIGRCTALERISWSGPLLGLPEEMEELARLTHIFLRNTNFSELPSVLERIPHLECVSIENNQQPIRKISGRLWTNLMGWGFAQTTTAWLFGQKIRVIWNLDLSQVRELPFEMQFLNNYTLPYIPSPVTPLPVGFLRTTQNTLWLMVMVMWSFLNLPIFLVNLFMATAVRPLVTAIRDELGYSRMVRLDNAGR